MASNTVGRPGKNTERSQYHHFIPRFILRNFADPNQFPTGPAKGRRKSKSKRRDALINSIDLHSVNVEQRWLSSEFGIVNMYREEDMGDGYDLEKRLSVLESDAARTIHKAKEALASGDRTLSIPRGERDCLRKFFFLMKYRNSHFYQRYNHESLKTYNSMDKRALSAFMKDRNLKRPKDVWFLNIRTFLSLEMDAKKQWMDKVQTLAYRDDALMFILHAQGSFMSFCTPESEEQEFVLTDNAYGIFEGPVSPFINAGLGTIHDGLCIEYHNFAPISPKLLIVFRSFVLPTPEDDGDTELRTVMLDAIRQLHIKPDATDSILKDLPVTKCQNSYSKIMDGKVVALPSFQEHRSDDLFFFTCFRLKPDHVDLINEIFLEQAWATSSIAFRSKNAMQRALRIYLRDKREGFKVVTDQPDDPRLKYLKTLETIVSRLGGSAMKALYQEVELPKPEVHMSHWVAHVVAGKLYKSRKDLYEVYKTLTAGKIISLNLSTR